MPAAFDEGDAAPALTERERAQGARESRAHDRDIDVDGQRHDARASRQREQDGIGRSRCSRLIATQAIATGVDAVPTIRKSIEIPEIGKHAHTVGDAAGLSECQAALEIAKSGLPEETLFLQGVERAVSRSRRDE